MLKIIYGFIVVQLLLVGCSQKKEEKPASPAKQVNEYPAIELRLQNGEQLSAKNLRGKNVFILFQPDCSHCQEEAIHFEQRLEEFKDYTLYFISSSDMNEIMAFAKNFQLDSKENVKFAWTASEGVLTYYGPIPTPSVYIYSDGKLRQAFNGQTEIENIIKAL
jgi:peroxiredoxin